MIYDLRHKTTYSYGAPVSYARCVLRLTPRSSPWQTVLSHTLAITPKPASMTQRTGGFGEKTQDPLTMYLTDICTVPTSLAGATAISLPIGLAPEDGLPVGLQIMGRAPDEARVLRAAFALEQGLGFSSRPAMWGGVA